MTSYAWLDVGKPGDFSRLTNMLDPEFDPARVASQLARSIQPAVTGVLVEFGYTDKDYRSTFYRYYAKMGRPYREDCVRLHFFAAAVSFDADTADLRLEGHAPPLGSLLELFQQTLQEHYFGYVVLRPTLKSTIGRSVLTPDVRIGAQGHAIQGQHRVHLLGYRLSFWGFPSMAQHADISVCAHVACWSILRHYSERYPDHRELLLHDITRMASPFDPGGVAPSLGLYLTEAERVFQAAGTFPLTISKCDPDDPKDPDDPEDNAFYAQLLAYLESGFPLFVALEEHAFVAMGYNWRIPAVRGANLLSTHVWEQVDTILAVDDNHPPYISVKRDLPQPNEDNPLPYSSVDFEAFIVALPEKIFYSAQAVEIYSRDALYEAMKREFLLPKPDDLQRRYFVTTISALRAFARKNRTQLGDVLLNMLMELRSAQFIWVVEYASTAQWANQHIAARAIIDASASPQDPVPVMFAHGEDKAIFFDRDEPEFRTIANALGRPANSPLSRMVQNLRPIKPRRGNPLVEQQGIE